MTLTIAFVTARRDCKIEWFFASLARQIQADDKISIIVVDHFAEESGRAKSVMEKFYSAFAMSRDYPKITITPPKPNVWNGPHRLTREDWFAMASARNTAICLCETTHLAFCDDLSVLMPGWLDAVRETVAGNYIGCGAYHKARNMVVENGVVKSYDPSVGNSGVDDRLKRVTEDVSPCDGGWLYGCSLVAPLEDLLEVGGFPEMADSLSSEDYLLGIALRNAGKHLKYCRKMMTFESEELHFVGTPMKRKDKGEIGTENDKSHAALRIAQASKYFPNYYEGGIRKLREDILSGKTFPTAPAVFHDWFDGQPIAEME